MKVALGIGCDRGTPLATLARAVDEALAMAGLHRGQVSSVGSITLKADETGLLALAAQAGWPLHFYPATQLAEVVVPNPSETVRRHTGSPSVSEAAALLAAGTTEASALCIEKHRLRGDDGRNATVSVARVMPRAAIPPCVANTDPARCFTAAEREAVQSLMQVRRDMRHFTAGAQVAEDVRARLQAALLAAPSVGLMQPLRVLRITDPALRERLAATVDEERMRTAQAMGPRAAEFLALKVEGVRECAELWALVLAPDDGTLFGRRTLASEMAWCSAGAAVQNLWLAARAENLGLGWVSLFEPGDLRRLLSLPVGAAPLGLLCIGPVDRFYETPMLIQQQWRQARPVSAVFTENSWEPSWNTGSCATPEHLPLG
ncbi:5,6-dimethylbenzimidazole synthase [Hydrogenophaga sp. D2P1]|jgi:5,6-dimethylbenzimidazole synthase|uniref:5,6-dimethylbenzimidazole synthase n=3 Tax=Hydrogenophaga TaxID=47420 RepID=A0A7Y8L039_9BURK|nr:5,6-dimethylbenzimidazole synthase [Hydrogenophaga aromaticivorans]NWF47818.1 5,6-dimethylbenzimidazole synthase [Hydrogenophaga aromaticivorans]